MCPGERRARRSSWLADDPAGNCRRAWVGRDRRGERNRGRERGGARERSRHQGPRGCSGNEICEEQIGDVQPLLANRHASSLHPLRVRNAQRLSGCWNTKPLSHDFGDSNGLFPLHLHASGGCRLVNLPSDNDGMGCRRVCAAGARSPPSTCDTRHDCTRACVCWRCLCAVLHEATEHEMHRETQLHVTTDHLSQVCNRPLFGPSQVWNRPGEPTEPILSWGWAKQRSQTHRHGMICCTHFYVCVCVCVCVVRRS